MSPLHPTPDGSVKNTKGLMVVLYPLWNRSISNPEKTSFDATSEIGKREKEKESSRIRDPVQMNLEAVAEQQNEVEFLLGFQVLQQVALFAHCAYNSTDWDLLPNWWQVEALKDLRSLAVAAPHLFAEFHHLPAFVDFRRNFEIGEFWVWRWSSRLQKRDRRRLASR